MHAAHRESSGLEGTARTRQHLEAHCHLLDDGSGRTHLAHGACVCMHLVRAGQEDRLETDRAGTQDGGAGGSDDRGLLGSDLFERVAQDPHVIEPDPGDDRNGGRRHARRVPPAAETDLENRNVDPGLAEQPERRCSGQLELGEPGRTPLPAGAQLLRREHCR